MRRFHAGALARLMLCCAIVLAPRAVLPAGGGPGHRATIPLGQLRHIGWSGTRQSHHTGPTGFSRPEIAGRLAAGNRHRAGRPGEGRPRRTGTVQPHRAVLRTIVLLNGSFAGRTLRPWQPGGALRPRLISWPPGRGHRRRAALIGRLSADPAVSGTLTSTLALTIALPAHTASAELTMETWQRCTTSNARSVLSITVQPGGSWSGRTRPAHPPLSLLSGCGLSAAWSTLGTALPSAPHNTVVVAVSAAVAPREAAALILAAVHITATVALSATPVLTPTGTITPLPTITGTALLSQSVAATGSVTATIPATGSATTPLTATAAVTPTPTPTDVPNLCVAPAISATYAAILPTFTPTPLPVPTRTPTITPTGTITPTPTPLWRPTATSTPTATFTAGPTPGFSPTPGPSPTVGTACHTVAKGISYGFVSSGQAQASGAAPTVGPGDADAVAATGARLVRIDFHLTQADSWTPDEYAPYDAAVNAFVSRNIDVLGLVGPGAVSVLYNPNAWLVNSYERTGGNGDNSFLHSYAARVLDLVGHFHDRIHTWELWNEPNVGKAGMTGTYLYPSNFAAMLADTYALVKQAYPDVTLVSGGVLAQDEGGHSNPRNAGADYLRQVYHMGLQVTYTWYGVRRQFGTDPLDAVGQHLYIDQGGLVYIRHIADAFRLVHDAYGSFGDGVKPLYVTEVAWRIGSTTPAQQALNLDMVYSMAQNPAFPYVSRVFWYLLRDGFDQGQAFGLIGYDGTPRPAYYRFLAY